MSNVIIKPVAFLTTAAMIYVTFSHVPEEPKNGHTETSPVTISASNVEVPNPHWSDF